MTRELFWLTLTVIFTGLLWVPYVLNHCQVRGLGGAMANPSRNDKPLADRLFAERVLHRTPIATPRCRVQRHPWRRVCSQAAFAPRRPLPLGIAA